MFIKTLTGNVYLKTQARPPFIKNGMNCGLSAGLYQFEIDDSDGDLINAGRKVMSMIVIISLLVATQINKYDYLSYSRVS